MGDLNTLPIINVMTDYDFPASTEGGSATPSSQDTLIATTEHSPTRMILGGFQPPFLLP